MTSHALVLASRWANPANRRREGLRAAHAQDADTLIDLLHTYMRLKSSRAGRISDKTLSDYAESVRRFLEFCGPPESPARALNQLSAEDFEVWLLNLQAAGLRENSVKRHLYGVRNLMKALVWAGVLKTDPSAGVRPPSDPTPAHAKKRALTLDDYAALLQLPLQRWAEQPARAWRDRALLELGGSGGCGPPSW
ncbi:site-specific integrase [Deinococcus lacus]|uniref:Site-specific integrase n=1 Tax=Deinococcus lacus TaxID=392561 RepID=A0ABW1YC39_9DEIO